MGYWSRLFGGKGARKDREGPAAGDGAAPDSDTPASAPGGTGGSGGERDARAIDGGGVASPEDAAHAAADAEIARLVSLATDGAGPASDEALAVLGRLRRTPHEARALDALAARNAVSPLPEPIAAAAAAAMLDRGEPEAALKLLRDARSSHALLLVADLHAERGDLAAAVAVVERVLLRELDHPGARERHRRWRAALGLETDAPRAEAAATTTMVASSPDTPYALLREVARGGAGAVYEANDKELGRRIALKVYHHPERDRAQLLHEARAAASLAGPGVVRVLDVDPEHGWLAIEWAPLGALREAVRRRDRELLVPLERWALPLASTLARIHAAGWVHYDVKPANVLFAAAERPVLADFGIARRAGAGDAAGGSLGYVSPERMAGRGPSPRDDVYGFGRVLEDVLDVVADVDGALAARWRPLAQACVARDESRLADASQIVTRIRTELSTDR